MDRNNEIFEATKTMNNLKNHDFSVANYKMCELESKVVMRALSVYLSDLRFDNLHVIDTLDVAT